MHSRQDVVCLYTPSRCFVGLLRARLNHWALKHLVRGFTLGHTHKQRMCMDSDGFLRLNHWTLKHFVRGDVLGRKPLASMHIHSHAYFETRADARVISGKPAERHMESGFQFVPGCLSANADMQISPLPPASITPPSRPKSRHSVMHRGMDCRPRAAPNCRWSHCSGQGESRSWLGRSQTWSPAQRP